MYLDTEESIRSLKSLVNTIYGLHKDINASWKQYAEKEQIPLFNQSKKQVCDIPDNCELMEIIQRYVGYLNANIDRVEIDDTQFGFAVSKRVKNPNSIEEKANDYIRYGKTKGKVSINKCFNDLFGVRAVVDCEDLPYQKLNSELCSGTDIKSI